MKTDMNDHTKQYRLINGHRVCISFAKEPNTDLFGNIRGIFSLFPTTQPCVPVTVNRQLSNQNDLIIKCKKISGSKDDCQFDIKRVDVYRNYELNVELNMNIRRFFLGMEESESIPITA